MAFEIGTIVDSHRWGQAVILGFDGNRADVRFLNTGNEENVHRVALYNGGFSDLVEKKRLRDEKEGAAKAKIEARLLSPTVHGVGFIGIGPHKLGNRVATAWRGMIRRCYSDVWQTRFPSYIGCTVCERWHNYQNFAHDFPHLEGFNAWLEGDYHLDKDLRVPGNKNYSPDTCVLVHKSENFSEAVIRMHQEGRGNSWGKKTKPCKVYQARNPKGEEVEITNMREFCESNGLTYTTMIGVMSGRKGANSHKGYTRIQ